MDWKKFVRYCGAVAVATAGLSLVAHAGRRADQSNGAFAASGTCPADIDASGAVDFGDILSILAAWGPCPGCPEDIDDDGLVGFSDLLIVLSAWGTTCAPAGACCVPDQGCIETTSADCADQLGSFLGPDTTCGSGACGAGVTGACCLPNGGCVVVDIPACSALGGVYLGVDTACVPGGCA